MTLPVFMSRRGPAAGPSAPSHSPEALLVVGFGALILFGALLLWLPWCHQPGWVGFLDALFTSTSAVCVTGLIVVDTGRAFTTTGQVIIMLLIQAGGLGIMSFAALVYQMLGSRMSLSSQAALHDSFFQQDLGARFKALFWKILGLSLSIEVVGAAIISVALIPREGAARGGFSALFHSVSAFCNAGFSLYSDNLIKLRANPFVVITVMALIVLGGLGYGVLLELGGFLRRLRDRERQTAPRTFTLHARVVFLMSAVLIVAGFVGLLIFGLTPGNTTLGSRLSAALFQSITARTAGFNTVNIGALPTASLILLVILMFIGGSPGSCAGGIKTTSFAVWIARVWARLTGSEDVNLLGRRIPKDLLRRTTLLISLALLWNGIGVLFLTALGGAAPGYGLRETIFEQISAFGTVGLSTGITSHLTALGRLWIILTMFVGRLGPLTMAMWIFKKNRSGVRYPVGRVMIG